MSTELLAYLPFGERHVKRSKQQKAAVQECRDDPSKWPQQVPSFELWAAATKYERGQHHGGLAFRTMMRLLLVNGNGKVVNIAAKPHVPKHEGKNSEWQTNDAKTHMNNNDTQHTPSTQGKLSTVDGGLPNGALSSNGTGFVFEQYNEQQGQIKIAADGYESRASIKPLTKLAWAKFCMGLADPKHGPNTSVSAGKHGSHTSFSSAHKAKTANASCDEVEGECLSLGNQLASIFGLYYYQGCDEAENNWMVKQTLGSKVYYIRMRAWNPQYTLCEADGRLLVREPLNLSALNGEARNERPPAWRQLNNAQRYVGSHKAGDKMKPGFWMPGISLYDSHPLQPSHVICQSHKKPGAVLSTAMAPWFGETTEARQNAVRRASSRADPLGDLAANLRSLVGDLVMEKTKGEDGICLGFVAPKAHWLYPHHVEPGSKLECVRDGKPGNSLLQDASAYQPCPQWHSRYKDKGLTAGCMVPNEEECLRKIKQNGLYYVTDLFGQERERLNQIRYALGDNGLPLNEDIAKAVDAMLAKHRFAADSPDEALAGLKVAQLRAIAKERGINVLTGEQTKAGPQMHKKAKVLAMLRAQPPAAVEPAAVEPAEEESDEVELEVAPSKAKAPSKPESGRRLRYEARQQVQPEAVEAPKQPARAGAG